MFKQNKYLWLLLVVIVFNGCKSRLILSNKLNNNYNNEAINKISEGFLDFETFSSRIKIEGKLNGEKQKFKGSIRIKRDSIVWISINLTTGLPVAKMIFEKDSVRILDRINDKLYIGDYSFLEKKYGLKLGYSIVESVFINEISNCEDEDYTTERELTSYIDSTFINCVVKKNDLPAFIVNYMVNVKTNKIEKTRIIANDKVFTIDYSDFDEVEDKMFPEKMAVMLDLKEKSFNLEIDLSKIHLDKNQKYPFKISKKVTTIKY